ncbi:MAG: hypothetical protein U5N86_06195 [Planctomycetota bacterium]|nr:hypothetical protein [Planctomycetota bacterium]
MVNGPSNILNVLEKDFREGKLEVLRHDIAYFIDEKTDRIRELLDERRAIPEFSAHSAETQLELALKEAILHSRILNPGSDARAQIEDIERHIWILGEKYDQPPDREQEALDWVRKFAASWREYRLLAILYVFEKNREQYLQRLKQTGAFDDIIEQ